MYFSLYVLGQSISAAAGELLSLTVRSISLDIKPQRLLSHLQLCKLFPSKIIMNFKWQVTFFNVDAICSNLTGAVVLLPLPYLLRPNWAQCFSVGSWSRQGKQRKPETIIVSNTTLKSSWKTAQAVTNSASSVSGNEGQQKEKKKRKRVCAPGLCMTTTSAITLCPLHSHLSPDGGLSENIPCFDSCLQFLLNTTLQQPGTKCFV